MCACIAALLPHEEVGRICNIQKHARSPLTAGHASAGTGEYEEQNGTAKEQYGVDDGLSEDMQRADHRGHSEDKQDVEQVGTYGDNAIASYFIFLNCFLSIKELK